MKISLELPRAYWNAVRSLAGAAAVGAALLVVACSDEPEGSTNAYKAGALNGSPANPTQVGVPLVWHVDRPNFPGVFIPKLIGSAVLVNDRWAITARHVIEPAKTDPVALALGDPSVATNQVREIDNRRIFLHPTRDMAVVRVKSPFTGLPPGALHAVSDRSRAQIIAENPTLDCYGWGDPLPLALRRGAYAPAAKPGEPFRILLGFIASMDFRQNDSGGPCLDAHGRVASIHKGDTGAPAQAEQESADGFYDFANDVVNSLIAVQGDVNGDGDPDFVFVGTTTVLGVEVYSIKVTFHDGSSVTVPTPTPVQVVAGALGRLLLVLGNFNGDKKLVGTQTFDYNDVVFGVDNKFVYLHGSASGLVAQNPFELIDSDVAYKDMNVGDFNNDGFADLELVRDDDFSQRDVYFGTANGLEKGTEFIGAPVDDPDEGRFSLITGSQEFTYPVPHHDFLISVDKDAPRTLVHVYDGYFGSRYDFGTGRACYRLYASKLGRLDPSDPTVSLVKSVDADDLAAHAWDTIYDGPHISAALNGDDGESYTYFLRAEIGSCAGSSQPLGANAFLVRANGDLGAMAGGIYPRDRSGPAAVANAAFLGSLPDTSYDGTFTFLYYAGEAAIDFYLRDADADRADDEDAPSFENIASLVEYTMTSPTGKVLTNDNPSGQYSPHAGQPKDVEDFKVAPWETGIWTQKWHTLLQGNMVYLDAVVKGSPEVPLPRLSRPRAPRSVSSARSPEWWMGEASEFLPVTLGAGTASTDVHTSHAASTILSGSHPPFGGSDAKKVSVCHGKAPPAPLLHVSHSALKALLSQGGDTVAPAAMAALTSELLAAKLNVKRAQERGEPLEAALVYGRLVVVQSAILEGDTLLRSGSAICQQSLTFWSQVLETTRLLRAVNRGEVSYIAPRVYVPPVLNSSNAQSAISAAGL